MKRLIGVVVLQLACFDLECLTRSREPVYSQNIFVISAVELRNVFMYFGVCVCRGMHLFDDAASVC